MTNEAWREIVEVEDNEGRALRVKHSRAYHHGRERFVTILGVFEPDQTMLVYQDGQQDINQPVRTAHYSWFRRNK